MPHGRVFLSLTPGFSLHDHVVQAVHSENSLRGSLLLFCDLDQGFLLEVGHNVHQALAVGARGLLRCRIYSRGRSSFSAQNIPGPDSPALKKAVLVADPVVKCPRRSLEAIL